MNTKEKLVWDLSAAQIVFIQKMLELGESKEEIARCVRMKKSTFEMAHETLSFGVKKP